MVNRPRRKFDSVKLIATSDIFDMPPVDELLELAIIREVLTRCGCELDREDNPQERFMFRNLSLVALDLSATQSELNELALSHRFRGFELPIGDYVEQAKNDAMAYSKRLIESAKLTVTSFRLPLEWDTDDESFAESIKNLTQLCEIAQELGCKRVETTIAPGTDLRPYHENFELHRKRFTEVAATLANYGMQLGVGYQAAASLRAEKSFEFIHQFEPLQMLISTVGGDNVGAVLDTWQFFVSGDDIGEAIGKLGSDKIVNVVLSDAPAESTPEELTPASRLLPGETGEIDSSAILTALANAEYQGPITPLADPSTIEEQGREKVVQVLGEALDKVWKEAGLSPTGKLVASA